ncbi:MAG TPA: toll/interleukin-1 receptor domain-containing protein [Ktedonobacteraceae bacterium]|jgi:hypothetical protein|nr:toll/interleukin-1 receptor domain-containing protein [Ktedonobacteraceae bacterium]
MPAKVFYAYAHADERFRQELEMHLSPLRRQGLIAEWHDRQIRPGADWKRVLDEQLNTASVILLLISPDFLASDYLGIETQRALERHSEENIHVIPILLRPVDLQRTPFAHLQILPRNSIAITSWVSQDEAFREVAQDIRLLIEGQNLELSAPPSSLPAEATAHAHSSLPPSPGVPQTGPHVKVVQMAGTVEGSMSGVRIGTVKKGVLHVEQEATEAKKMMGVKAGSVQGGDIFVRQNVGTVNESGEVTGMSTDELG